MASIPAYLNTVTINFKDKVNNNVDEKLVTALSQIIRPIFPLKYTISSITVSSLFDSHDAPDQVNSRHNQQKAIDISRINNKPVVTYGADEEVTTLVEYIQKEFEKVPGRRENFGPYFKLKAGAAHSVRGHSDHIHLSVD